MPKKILLIGLIILGVSALAYSQVPKAIALDNSGNNWKVTYSLTESVPKSDVKNIVLLDATNGNTFKITNFQLSDDGLLQLPDGSSVSTTSGITIPSIMLSKTTTYFLVVTIRKKQADGTFENVPMTSPKIIFVAPNATSTKVKVKQEESSDKRSSDVFIAGEMNGSKGKKTAFSTEIKIAPRFSQGRWNHIPFFTLNASTSPSADPDNLEFGYAATRSFNFYREESTKQRFAVDSLFLSVGGKFEAVRNFNNVNVVFNPRLDFVTTPIPVTKTATMVIIPFIGTELGKNLKSPLAAAEGGNIARALGGAYLLLNVPVNNSALNSIVWETTYTRRFLFANELGFTTDNNNQLVLTKYGKKPRDFFQSRIDFTVNQFINPFIAYEWGELPPAFKLVDHKFRIGFVYKFKLSIGK